eukprot:scaffold2017_cov387-Prasinococcus_capsulatus_cf.AAC.9
MGSTLPRLAEGGRAGGRASIPGRQKIRGLCSPWGGHCPSAGDVVRGWTLLARSWHPPCNAACAASSR